MTRLLRRLWVLVLMVGLIAGCLPSLHSVPLAVSPVARPSTVQVNLQLDLPRRIQSLPAAWDEIMLSVTASGSGPLSQTKAANAAQIFTFQLVPGPATVSCELHNQGSVVARGSTTATLAAGNNPVRIALQAFSPFVSSLGTTVVTPNSTLTLEGNFPGASTTVTFQGGASAIATPLGPNRVQVTIPANAQSGPMTVTSSGSSTVAPPVRVVTYGLGVQAFQATYDQINGARQTPSLLAARRRASCLVLGTSLYVVGGLDVNGNALSSIERATINADGTLGPFTAVGNLNTARSEAAMVPVGNSVYVLGGTDGTNALSSIERATIAPDGTLGTFTAASGALSTPRNGLAVAVVGNHLYALGGSNGQASLASIEQAAINADGTLGAFSATPGGLLQPRQGLACAVLGSSLYAVGGSNAQTPLASVERATINADGSLGAFASAGVNLGSARAYFGSAVMGNRFVVLGGLNGTPATGVETATVASDGTLGAFSSAGNLTSAREGLVAAIAGNYLYALGGYDGSSALSTLERASINGTGVLGADQPAGNFTTQRSEHAIAVIGNRLYVLGGYAGQGTARLTSVEAANVSPDGVLGAFSAVPGVGVREGDQASTAVIGNNLYVLGGRRVDGAGFLAPYDFVQRATINPDGSISDFVSMGLQANGGIHLQTPRYGHATLVSGKYLYVMGGSYTGFFQGIKTIERATIQPDGTIGNFQDAGVTIQDQMQGATCLILGRFAYLIGGQTGVEPQSANYTSGIEQAPIQADGTIGNFTDIKPNGLINSRTVQASALIGNQLYVLGGHDRDSFRANTGRTDVEVATVQPDGTLGPFSVSSVTVPGVVFPRNGVQFGNSYYMLGSEQTGIGMIDRFPLQ